MALARDGIDTILTGRSVDKLEEVRKDIGDCAGEIRCMKLDLADISSVECLAREVRESIVKLDILVNCGGMYDRGSIADASIERFDEFYNTNIRGAYALTKSMLPALKEARGDIVFVNSSVVFSNAKNVGQFAATQHALLGIANSIRAEVNDDDIRVLTVYPGRTATPRQKAIFKDGELEYRPHDLLQPTDIAEIVVACLNLPATAEVTDLQIRPRRKW